MRLLPNLSAALFGAVLVTAAADWQDAQIRLKDDAVDPTKYVAADSPDGPKTGSASSTPKVHSEFLNEKTEKYVVDGSALPEVNFDVGESFAGLMPIGNADDTDGDQLYFWFFPSTNAAADKEILIWLTGGPGCSSTGELLAENGPMLWQPGVYKPVKNKWSWHHLTNVVWVDQPVGSGFSQGNVTVTNQYDVARQFMGFWKNFVDTFAMQGYKVYITGSSYSGLYCPYVASAMLDAEDKEYYDVAGMQVFAGLYSKLALVEDVPAAAYVDFWKDIFSLNDTFVDYLHETADECGYTAYLDKFLTFPPEGPQPAIIPGEDAGEPGSYSPAKCNLFSQVDAAIKELSPCSGTYNILQRCPMTYDPIGFSFGTRYVPDGAGPIYFDREDVKRAINAPVETRWSFCNDEDKPVFVEGIDGSLLDGPGSQPVLPNVIDKTQNVIIGHGTRDFILIDNGTMLAFQNMTWGGKLGFQTRPSAPLYVPYHNDASVGMAGASGAGVMGTVHTERGLTYFDSPVGHFLAMDSPSLAFRSVEVLLGRVDSLESTAPFTTDADATAQPSVPMGKGTVPIGEKEL